jgi:hypothetical protein
VFNFTGGETALNGGPAPNQYNAYASFLLGVPNNMGKSLQYLTMSGREWQFGWYARDRWQVTQNLTLTLGLRYEYYPLMTRADRGLERWDPETNLVLFGRRGGNPDNVGMEVSKKLFAPRVGLAYRIGNSTVIRSGYGITYDPLPFSRPLRGPYPATISQTFPCREQFFVFPNAGARDSVLYRTKSRCRLGDACPQQWTIARLGAGWCVAATSNRGTFIVEHRLPGDFVTTVGYVGTATVHHLADLDINAAPVGGGTAGRPLFARLGRTAATTMWGGFLSANYHSFQSSVSRSMRGGLLVRGAYTFSARSALRMKTVGRV